MKTVSRHLVTSDVRPAGTDLPLERRSFDLMLGSDLNFEAKRREAIRILKQIGYDCRGINLCEFKLI